MLKGLKKTMDKEQKEMRKMIYEQNRVSINRNFYKKELSRNSGAKKYNNWNEKVTRGVQKQIWAGRKASTLEDRSLEIIESGEQTGKKKWTEPLESVGYCQECHHMNVMGVSSEEKRGRNNIWRNNYVKLPKFRENDEIYISNNLNILQAG